MTIVIDTNSLLALVRYYLPFDKNGLLIGFIKSKIESGECIIIDKVLEECTYISKGLVISNLGFLKDKVFLKTAKVPYKTNDLFVPDTKQFFHQLNSVFVNSVIRKKLSDVEFESEKSRFIESADLKQVILALNLKNNGDQVVLVTEETQSSNDNKTFKKIPSICKELGIETLTFPQFIEKSKDINIEFTYRS